jgi:hypothetical protein
LRYLDRTIFPEISPRPRKFRVPFRYAIVATAQRIRSDGKFLTQYSVVFNSSTRPYSTH